MILRIAKDGVKKVLPDSLWKALHHLKNKPGELRSRAIKRLSQKCKAAGAESKLWAKVYYALFSSAFDRELQAVLSGQLQYEQLSTSGVQELSLLRRNVHRIEKGLIMKPRRDTFALGYIQKTVDVYLRVARQLEKRDTRQIDRGEIAWAHDVLNEYFDVVADHPVASRAHKAFQSISLNDGVVVTENERGTSSGVRAPYYRNIRDAAIPAYEDLLSLVIQRRSVRWFKDRRVPRTEIDKALKIARQAPSACNRQPFEYRVYDDPGLVRKIAVLPGGTKGYAQNIPVIVVLVGHLRAYFSERDRHLIYIDASLSAMSFMLALETLGLSSCSINWPDVEEREKKMAETINLQPDERPVMLLAVGYPNDDANKVAYSQKKDITRIGSYNKL